jgi:hypothetical protein
LKLPFEGIKALIDSLEKESKALKEELLRLCWFMRGSITYDDAMLMSHQERELIGKIIKDNLDTTKKSGLPFF